MDSWYEKLLDAVQAIFTLRHGVVSAMTIAIVVAIAGIVALAWLHGSLSFAVLVCVIFLVGVAAVLYVAIKAPALVAIGGPDLPTAKQIAGVGQLFGGRRGPPPPNTPEAMTVQTNPDSAPRQLPAPEIEAEDQ